MKKIRQAAVLGAGVMGAGIAAHLVNGGLKVVLLDMVPQELTAEEKEKGLSLEDPGVRNRYAEAGLRTALRTRAFYSDDGAGCITTGNFDDDIKLLRECDWVVEAIVENMEIKKQLFSQKVLPNLKPGAVLTTNTSGLSVTVMAEVLPEEVRRNFLVTHFFNPPRQMRLLELVPSPDTAPSVVEDLSEFCRRRLGKGIVLCKDTPNFIANRIGVFTMCNGLQHMETMGLGAEEVDAVSGPATARPSTALARLFDLVGIDTMKLVAANSHRLLEDDEDREIFKLPVFVETMVEKGLIGRKAGQGFYRREKDGSFSCYDAQTGDYRPMRKVESAAVAAASKLATPAERLKAVLAGDDAAARFAWYNLRDTLLYAVKRIPEITEDIEAVDNAMKWGYSWSLGPFEMLDTLGVKDFVNRVEGEGITVPAVLKKVDRFYTADGSGNRQVWDLQTGTWHTPVEDEKLIDLKHLRRSGSLVEGNGAASIHDLQDGVFGLEFHSKMNAIDMDTLEMVERARERAENEGIGLVIANQGRVFSAGANLGYFARAIEADDGEALDGIIRAFQTAVMGLKYSCVPVVAAPFALALGGGCEVVLHCACINAHAEIGMGLVEVGVGLIPAGGGTKEMALRAMEAATHFGGDVLPFIEKYYHNIVSARISTSASNLFDMGMMRRGDGISMDIAALIADAKERVRALASNYLPPQPKQVAAAGPAVAEDLKMRVREHRDKWGLSDYDLVIADLLADIMTGSGAAAGSLLSEWQLLDFERETFNRLCRDPRTLERIQHMLKKGKKLKN